MKNSAFVGLVAILLSANALAQCPTLGQNATFTSADCQPGSNPCALCPGDQYTLTPTGSNLHAGDCINWYISDMPNFNPYNGEGTLLGCSALSSPPPDPCNPNPIFLGIFVNACGTEENNEFMGMWSGGGFNLSDLTATYEDPANNGCSWQTPSAGLQATISSECPGAVFVGAGEDIPANVPVVIFTSSQADFDYSFGSLCAVNGTIYVTQSDCSPGTEVFPNSGSGTVTTTLSIGCWTDDITYDLSQINNADGAYVAEIPILGVIYGQAGCGWPSFPGLPGTDPVINIEPLDVTVDQDQCNNGPFYIVGIYDPLPFGCPETFTNYLTYDVLCPTPVLGTTDLCSSVSNYNLVQLQDPAVPDGVWSGTGVNGSIFDATGLSGPIELTFTPNSPCGTPASTFINVFEAPTATFEPVQPVCAGGVLTLTVNFTGTPDWTFNLLANGIPLLVNVNASDTPFDIQVSPLFNTTYTIQNLTDDSSCLGANISVFVPVSASSASAVLTLVGNDTICSGSSTNVWIDFTGGVSPYDFVYALNGVSQPPQLGIAVNPYIFPVTITDSVEISLVSLTDSNGCPGTVSGSDSIWVLPAPTASLVSDTVTICEGASDTLTINFTGTAPFTFIYRINGMNQAPITADSSPYILIVSPSTGIVDYTLLSVNDSICPGAVSGIYRINVTPAPTATLSGLDTICAGQSTNLVINFTGSPPYMVDYTANNVPQTTIQALTNPYILPVMPSVNTIYELTALGTTGCPGMASGTATVIVPPVPTAVITGGGQICQGGSGTTITVTFTGTGPFNFVYSANNIDQPPIATSLNPYTFTVNPNAGTGYRLVTYSDGYCDGTVSGLAQVFVFVPASATMSGDGIFCDSTTTDVMVDFNGSGPFTIEYTIDGVLQPPVFTSDDPYFIPVSTDVTTVYTLVNVESPGCVGIPAGSATITVNYAPTYSNLELICNPLQNDYQVSFTLTGATLPLTFISGGGNLVGDQFTSDPISQSSDYLIQFHDANDCGDITVSGVSTCNCSTESGDMDLNLLELCETQVATAVYNGVFVDDGDDILTYILHTNPGLPIGTILAWNSSPVFSFQAGMVLTTTYYISAIAGNPGNNGQVDLNDPCLSVSQGTPVIFYPRPTGELVTSSETVCLGDTLFIDVYFSGAPSFSFTPQFGTTPQGTISGITSSPYSYGVYTTQDTTVSLSNVSNQYCPTGNTSGMVDITVAVPPSIGPVTTLCDYTNETYTISFPVTGTQPFNLAGVLASFNGMGYTSLPIPFGTPYLAYLTDAKNCGTDTLSGLGVCSCLSDAGIMSQTQVNACQEDTLTVPSATGFTVDPSDQLMYILHSNPGTPIGTVFGWSNTPSFVFGPPMLPNTIYYVSSIVGNPDGMGQIDLNDPCLSVADGTPVLWHPIPTASLTNGTFNICPGGAQALIVSLTGTPNYTLTYTSNGTIFNVAPTQNLFSINAQLQQSATIILTSVVDANGCVGTVSGMAQVNVHQIPVAINIMSDCNFVNQTYILEFDIIKGDSTSINIANMAGIYDSLTGHFISDPIPAATPYSFTLSDAWACGDFTATGMVDCSCVTDAGSMNSGNLVLCPGEVATTPPATGFMLEPGDTLLYYLVSTPSPTTWTILGANTSPSFSFNPLTMMYDSTYHIVAAAGDTLLGAIDLMDPCLSSTPGPTVVWRMPVTATLSGLDTICIGSNAMLQVSFSGSGPYSFTYSDGGAAQALGNISQNPYSFAVNPVISSNYMLLGISGAGACIGTVGGSASIQVNQLPQAVNLLETCDLFTETYILSFDISNGPAINSNYSISGMAGSIIDTTFTSLSNPGAQPYQITITDDIGCSTTITGQPACVCTSSAGTLSNIQDACLPNGMVSAQSNGNSNLDTNDVIRYILCSDPATLPAGLLAESNSPQFAFQTGMMAETIYYIVIGVGDPLPNGSLDFAAPCFSLSAGFPVVFHDVPTGTISGTADVCPGGNASLSIDFTGIAPYNFVYAINGVPQPMLTVSSNTFLILSDNIQQDQIFTLISLEDANCDGTISGQANVNLVTPPTGSLIGDATICIGDSAVITLNLSGANDYDVTISGGSSPIILPGIQNGASVPVSPTSTSTYIISNLIANGNICPPVIGTGVTITTDQVFATATVSDYNGFNLSCPNDTDGSIVLNVQAGAPPITAAWSDGFTGTSRFDLAAGAYQVTLSDQFGCSLVQDFDLMAPPELVITFEVGNPLCFGTETGFISVSNISGGAGPFNLLVNNEALGTVDTLPVLIPQLPSGIYSIGIEDSNGCISDEEAMLQDPAPLMVDLGSDTTISYGDSLFLLPMSNAIQVDTFSWSPIDYLSTPNQLGTWSTPPISMQYSIYLRDNLGCEASDRILVAVRKDHRVYIPNIIYPQSNNGNNIVTVWSGAEVAIVKVMRIFDRWGELIFENQNFSPNDPQLGWDGTFHGEFVNPAVFIYLVEVEYIDGETEIIKGDVTVIR